MLAVKLHFKRRPFLGRGSFLVPITTWKVASHQIGTWLNLLTSCEGGTGRRSYITLVKIPDEHWVHVGIDWLGFDTEKPMPLKDIPQWIKDELMRWVDHRDEQNNWVGSKWNYAQIRLADPLPRRCVKWTKDIRLLHRGDKRQRLRQKL